MIYGSVCSGEKCEKAVDLLSGITCGNKGTSCADQVAQMCKEYNKNMRGEE